MIERCMAKNPNPIRKRQKIFPRIGEYFWDVMVFKVLLGTSFHSVEVSLNTFFI